MIENSFDAHFLQLLIWKRFQKICKGVFIMTRKQIEAARERRLWLTQIVVPVTSTAVAALSIPEVRQTIAAKALRVKAEAQYQTENLKRKFHKK